MGTAPAPASEGTAKSTSKTATKASGAGTKAKKPASRKKKPSKSSGASANQAIYNAARAAQMELAGQRSAAAARLSDPMWYRVEDVLPATTDETAMALPSTKILPEQVQIVEAALANNNLTRFDVTPQAFCVLLEQARRHALEIMADAQDYAVCANRTEITKADFELASEMRPDHPTAITTQLPKLNLLAQHINRIPLPPIPSNCYSGVLLPPKQHQLTARTFDVVSGAQVLQKMVQPPPSLATKKVSSSSKLTPKPSYGAAKGRQIPIQLKETSAEKKAVEVPSISSATPGGVAPMEVSSPAAAADGAPSSADPTPAKHESSAPAPALTTAPTSDPVPPAPSSTSTLSGAPASTGASGAGSTMPAPNPPPAP